MQLGIEYAFAQNGADIITNAAAHNGQWMAIHVLEAAVLDTIAVHRVALNGVDVESDTALNLPLGVGAVLYGTFDQIKLTSGKVIAYRRPRT